MFIHFRRVAAIVAVLAVGTIGLIDVKKCNYALVGLFWFPLDVLRMGDASPLHHRYSCAEILVVPNKSCLHALLSLHAQPKEGAGVSVY